MLLITRFTWRIEDHRTTGNARPTKVTTPGEPSFREQATAGMPPNPDVRIAQEVSLAALLRFVHLANVPPTADSSAVSYYCVSVYRKARNVAKELVTNLIDDLSGKPADQTVRYGLDGIEYEIDLSHDNAAKLRNALARYLAVSRRMSSTTRANKPRGRKGGTSHDARAIRTWAIDKGYDINPRGRVPGSVVSAYLAATE